MKTADIRNPVTGQFVAGLDVPSMEGPEDGAGLFAQGEDGVWRYSGGLSRGKRDLFDEEVAREVRARPERPIEGRELERLAASKGLEVATAEDIAADGAHEAANKGALDRLRVAGQKLADAEREWAQNPTERSAASLLNKAQDEYEEAASRCREHLEVV